MAAQPSDITPGHFVRFAELDGYRGQVVLTGSYYGIAASVGRKWVTVVVNSARPRRRKLSLEQITNPDYRPAKIREIDGLLRSGRANGMDKGTKRALWAARAALRDERKVQE